MAKEHDVTLGALLIGLCVACGVFGVLTSQTITYYQRYFHDKWLYKCLVSASNFDASGARPIHVGWQVGMLWYVRCHLARAAFAQLL